MCLQISSESYLAPPPLTVAQYRICMLLPAGIYLVLPSAGVSLTNIGLWLQFPGIDGVLIRNYNNTITIENITITLNDITEEEKNHS